MYDCRPVSLIMKSADNYPDDARDLWLGVVIRALHLVSSNRESGSIGQFSKGISCTPGLSRRH